MSAIKGAGESTTTSDQTGGCRAVLCICVALASCGDTVVVVQAPTTTAPAVDASTGSLPGTTIPTTRDATIPAASPTKGTLVITLGPVGATTLTAPTWRLSR